MELNPDEVEEIRHGHRIKADPETKLGTMVRGVSTQGELVALLESMQGEDDAPEWQPKKVFFQSG